MRRIIVATFVALVVGAANAAGWTRTPATRSHDLAFGLAAAPDGTVYAGTIFQARFDASPYGGASRVLPQGRNDAWLFAFARDGAPRWTRRIGGAGLTELRDIARGADGRVVAAGLFLDEITHDDGVALHAIGGADAFVAAFEASGAPAWLATFGGKGADVAFAVAPARDGFVVAGSFEHAMRVGADGAAPRVLRAAGRRDAFVARLDASGRVVDASAYGGPGDDRAVALAAAPDGGHVVLILHQGGVALDDRVRIAARGLDDALVLAFDAAGGVRASATFGHEGPDVWDAITVADDGHVWVGGSFVGARALEVAGRTRALRSAGSSDVVLARFDPSLGSARVERLGNDAADTLSRLAPAGSGAVYAAGSSSGAMSLGRRRYESGGPRAWVARIDRDDGVVASLRIGADGITQLTGLVAYERGRVALAGLYEKSLHDPAGGIDALGKTDPFVAVRALDR